MVGIDTGKRPRASRGFELACLCAVVLAGCPSASDAPGGDSGMNPMDGGVDASALDGSTGGDGAVVDGDVPDGAQSDAGVVLPPSMQARQFVSDLIDRVCTNYDAGCLDGSDKTVTAARLQHVRDAYPATLGATCRTAMMREILPNAYYVQFAPGQDPLDALAAGILSSELGVPSDTSASFDATEASTCLTTLGSGCYDLGDLGAIAACRRTFGGDVALGGTCSADWQCADDAYCGPEVLGDGSCTRSVCRSRPTPGQACLNEWDHTCAASATTGNASCAYDANHDYVCGFTPIVVGVLGGQPCGAIGGTEYRCAADLQCDYSTDYSRSGVCVARIAASAACRPNGTNLLVCESGQSCVYATSTTGDHRCLPISIAGVGADCYADGVECDVSAGLTCEYSAGDTCVTTYGSGALNAPCRPRYGGDDCASGLWCAPTSTDRTVGVCAPIAPTLGGPGQACNSAIWWTDTCFGSYACVGLDPTTSTCQPTPLADGSECRLPGNRNLACMDGHVCAFAPGDYTHGYCSPSFLGYQAINGTNCDVDGMCASGYCAEVGDYLGIGYSWRRCTTRGLNGDACAITTNLGCNLGLYCDTASASPTCKPELTTGTACTATYQCSGWGYCADEGDGMGQVCHSPRKADLASCTVDRECLGGLCRRTDGSAAATLVCRTGTLAVGLGCTSAWDCETHRCSKSTGDTYSTCQPPAPLGTTCSGQNVECQAGLICDTSSYRCANPLPDGGYCNWQSSQCASGNCWESYCKPKRADGVTCQVSSECASGNCVELYTRGPRYCMTGLWSYACF